jgi:hypothetical protein
VARDAENVIGVLVAEERLLNILSGARQAAMGEVATSAVKLALDRGDAVGQGVLRFYAFPMAVQGLVPELPMVHHGAVMAVETKLLLGKRVPLFFRDEPIP